MLRLPSPVALFPWFGFYLCLIPITFFDLLNDFVLEPSFFFIFLVFLFVFCLVFLMYGFCYFQLLQLVNVFQFSSCVISCKIFLLLLLLPLYGCNTHCMYVYKNGCCCCYCCCFYNFMMFAS